MWTQAQWPDSRIEEFGDKLTEIIKGVQWNWDPAMSAPRFRAFPPGPWTLGIYVDGRWWLDKNGGTVAQGTADSFETGARELLAVYKERTKKRAEPKQ